ncbi:MAG: hypothetical protein Q8R74_01800 [Methylophilus sp.]|jgi:hypothetical protein|nr:hypothetical protein [Methylophilus sp.]
MTNRIPPSLNWLIDKRARISGEIEKTRRSLKRAQVLIKELEELEVKLKAIDTALDLHDIKIDVNLIKPIASNTYRLNIPHGDLTKSILTCIRLNGTNKPVAKSVIHNFVVARHFDFDADEITHAQVSLSIKRRLNCLYHKGLLLRHHSPNTSEYGLWSFSPKYFSDHGIE